jgi:hypothetical protein
MNLISLSWGIAIAATTGVILRPFRRPEAILAVTVDALRGERAESVTRRDAVEEANNVPVTSGLQLPRDSFLDSAPNAELLRLAVAIADGRARPTVRSIRDFILFARGSCNRLRGPLSGRLT